MRYILIILVFLSVGANAQMVIKAHANYRPYASPAANLLLDDYPNAAAAYSLRKLDKDYAGNCIRVRRSNDNAESDIGFTSSGDLDTATLKTFVGANNGLVVRWYDQSGSARDASQSTAANQPRIVNAGVVERQNNKVAVVYDGSNDVMTVSSFNNNALSLYIVFSRATGAQLGTTILRKGLTTNVSLEFGLRNNITTNVLEGFASTGAATVLSSTSPNALGGNQIRLGILIFDNSNVKVGLDNNALVSSALSGNLFQGTAPLIIGGLSDDAGTTFVGSWEGRISELIIYGTDKTSDNTNIKTNINTHYGIY
jgi:hypothetical protein